MATLKNSSTGTTIYLNAQHTFGRNQRAVNTFLPEGDISQSHAVISWKGNAWYLQDYSRNGTLIDGKFINNITIQLTKNQVIQFGEHASSQWKISDLDAPCNYFQSQSNDQTIIALHQCYAFPNEESPNTLLYPINGVWKIEQENAVTDLKHGELYYIDKKPYRYRENNPIEDTMDNGYAVNKAYFQFILSSDEEHIRVKIIIEHQEIDLGERVHNYILLALARKRLLDVALDYVFEDQGWIDVEDLLDDMSKELRKEVDVYYLNLKIYRIRKLLIETKPYGPLFSNLIERRQGKIRFAHRYFQILKEEECIGEVLAIAN